MKLKIKSLTILIILAIVTQITTPLLLASNPPGDDNNPPSGDSGDNPDNENEDTSDGDDDDDNKPPEDECSCDDDGGGDDDGGSGGDGDSGNDSGGDGTCIKFSIRFGRPLHSQSVPTARLHFKKDSPTPTIFSPQSLRYSLTLNSYIHKVETENLDQGIASEVYIVRPNGFNITYRFIDGETIGKPVEQQQTFRSTLLMTDANGIPVTTNPLYYIRTFDNGATAKFSAATLKLIEIKQSNGEITTIQNTGIEVIKEGWILRQIFSKTDGLADIVVDDYKYEIRIYNLVDVGAKDSNGIYTVSGTPRMKWIIENPMQSDTDIDHVKFTQAFSDGSIHVYNWEYLDTENDWTVSFGNGAKTIALRKEWNSTKTEVTTTETTYNVLNEIIKKESIVAQKFPFGFLETSKTIDPDGVALRTTKVYYDDETQIGKYGRLKSIQYPDGYWENYDYDTDGRMIIKIKPFKDSPFETSASQAQALNFSYLSHDPDDIPIENDNRVRTEIKTILGSTVAKKYNVYKTNTMGEFILITERCTDTSKPYGDPSNLKTIKIMYAPNAGISGGRIKTIQNPNGTLKTYTYELGSYTYSTTPGASTFTAGVGDALRTTIVNGTTNAPAGIANKTIKKTIVSDQFGNKTMSETFVYDGSGYNRIAWRVSIFDTTHRRLVVYNSNNTERHITWSNGLKASEFSTDATEYTYAYNALQQLSSKTKKGTAGTHDIVTTYTYDVEGRRLSSSTVSNGLNISTSATYNVAGKILTSADQSGLTTTYSYANGGRTNTITKPSGATIINDKYLCRYLKSTTGTAVIPSYINLAISAEGFFEATTYTALNMGSRYAKTAKDALNRTLKTTIPSFSGGTIVSTNTYNNKSQLIKTTKTGSASTLYIYDDLGSVVRSGLDIDNNGSLTLASSDRISESETLFANESGDWYQKSTSKTYATDNNATATTTAISKRQLTGLAANEISKSIIIDIYGNTTTSTTTLDSTNKTVTQTTNQPDSTTDAVSTTVNGLLQSQKTAQNLTYSYTYDALGRRTSVTDPRTGATATTYHASGMGKIGKVHTVTDAASNTTTFDYSATTGRRTKVTNALAKDTIYTYNNRGQVTSVTGPATYPLGYIYDSYGTMINRILP